MSTLHSHPRSRASLPLLLFSVMLLLFTTVPYPAIQAAPPVGGAGATQTTLVPEATLALAPASSFVQVDAGDYHTCALTSGGGVKCWGRNVYGSLGDGSTTNRLTPADVTGLQSGVTAISAGSYHTCALTSGGGVKCWGYNEYGGIGDGSLTTRLTPVDVIGLSSGVTAISAGATHTCALTSGGGVTCWGGNVYGSLGDGTNRDRLTPVDVTGVSSGVTAIIAGGYHTCALTNGGGVTCWGENAFGQIGDGTSTPRLTPVDVLGLSGVSAISAGRDHTCALTSGGGIKCWGLNDVGQIGDGSTTNRLIPSGVVGLNSGMTAISAGSYHTCALTSSGGVKCWGRKLALGDGTFTESSTPVDTVGLSSGVSAITAGWDHTCALTNGGGIKCWGGNAYGQLGDGTNATHLTPVDVTVASHKVTVISAGDYHTCALTSDGGLTCWGDNQYGQLGNGMSGTNRLTPVDVSSLSSGATAISAGYRHTCALAPTMGGGVKCWGQNGAGEIGDGTTTDRLTPVDVSLLVSGASGVTTLSAGSAHTCALTMWDGSVKCWGNNTAGELGDGSTTSRVTQVDVTGLSSGVTAISAGATHTCALTSGGGVKCWGGNQYGQLGDGSTTNRLTPTDVTGLTSGVTAISAGRDHTCALTSGGGIKCWGYNGVSQLGDGTTTDRLTSVDVTGLSSGMSAISAGRDHTCALTSGGGVKCWGSNGAEGKLGDGTTTTRSTPVDVVGLSSGMSAISTGNTHTCALTNNGGVKCWGANDRGQLGDGSSTGHLTPVDVIELAVMISGHVKDRQNKPIADVTLTLSQSTPITQTATTNISGTYMLSDLAAGSYTLTPTKSGYSFAPVSRSVSPSGDLTGQDFVATPTDLIGTELVQSVSPKEGISTQVTRIVVKGNGFATSPAPTVSLSGGASNIALTDVIPQSTTSFSATVPLGLSPGLYDLVVTTNGHTGTLPNAFTVLAANPQITQIVPTVGFNDRTTDLLVQGLNFAAGAVVTLGSTPITTTRVNGTTLLALVPANLTPNTYILTVTNPDRGSAQLADAYTVLDAAGTVNDDLFSTSDQLWLSPVTPRANTPVQIGLFVQRSGGKAVLEQVPVAFHRDTVDGPLLGTSAVPFLDPRASSESTTALNVTFPSAGTVTIYARIDPQGTLIEGNTTNNVISRTVVIAAAGTDQTPPAVQSIGLNGGSDTTVTASDMTVDIQALDPPPNASGVQSVHLIEYVYNDSAQRWVPVARSGWLPYTQTPASYRWSLLPLPGMHYVQVRARDVANNISVGNARQLINYEVASDQISRGQTRIYRYTVAKGQELSVNLAVVSGDADLYVWSSNTAQSARVSNQTGSVNEQVIIPATEVTPGVYQVEIYGYAAAEYRLTTTTKVASTNPASLASSGLAATKVAPSAPIILVAGMPDERTGSVPQVGLSSTSKVYLPLAMR